jgi:hypothetical protein
MAHGKELDREMRDVLRTSPTSARYLVSGLFGYAGSLPPEERGEAIVTGLFQVADILHEQGDAAPGHFPEMAGMGEEEAEAYLARSMLALADVLLGGSRKRRGQGRALRSWPSLWT